MFTPQFAAPQKTLSKGKRHNTVYDIAALNETNKINEASSRAN
jgi:hypothetical protein